MPAQERIDSVCSGLPGTVWSVRILRGDAVVAEVDPAKVSALDVGLYMAGSAPEGAN